MQSLFRTLKTTVRRKKTGPVGETVLTFKTENSKVVERLWEGVLSQHKKDADVH